SSQEGHAAAVNQQLRPRQRLAPVPCDSRLRVERETACRSLCNTRSSLSDLPVRLGELATL
ncbi:MAG: hypothetical protein ACYTFA_00650, partial [Planctomycetota bacterium]